VFQIAGLGNTPPFGPFPHPSPTGRALRTGGLEVDSFLRTPALRCNLSLSLSSLLPLERLIASISARKTCSFSFRFFPFTQEPSGFRDSCPPISLSRIPPATLSCPCRKSPLWIAPGVIMPMAKRVSSVWPPPVFTFFVTV